MEFFSFFFCFGEGKNNIRMWGVTQSVVDTEKFKYCAMQVERRAPPASFVANVKNFASFPSQSIKFSRKFPPRRFCSKKNFFHLFKRHKYKSRGEGRFMAVSCCFHRESWKLNRWLGVGKLPRKMKTFHCAWTLVSCKSLDSVWVALILTTVGCLFGSYHNRSKKKRERRKQKLFHNRMKVRLATTLETPEKKGRRRSSRKTTRIVTGRTANKLRESNPMTADESRVKDHHRYCRSDSQCFSIRSWSLWKSWVMWMFTADSSQLKISFFYVHIRSPPSFFSFTDFSLFFLFRESLTFRWWSEGGKEKHRVEKRKIKSKISCHEGSKWAWK